MHAAPWYQWHGGQTPMLLAPTQDEVLAHRMGLVPLAVHPERLELKAAEEAPSEKNTLVGHVSHTYLILHQQ